jgi:hypothetical protein
MATVRGNSEVRERRRLVFVPGQTEKVANTSALPP